MTSHLRQRRRAFPPLILVVMMGSALAGCGTSTIEDAVPEGTIRNTGVYPNINIVPTGETVQLSPAESETAKAELQAAKEAAETGAAETTVSTESELRAIAQNHGQEVVEEIEAE